MIPAPRSGVLRGVGVHAEPVRLGGGPAGADLAAAHGDAAARVEPAEALQSAEALEAERHQARQQGRETGLREGRAAAAAEIAAEKATLAEAMQAAVVQLRREQALGNEALARRFESVCAAVGEQVATQLDALERHAVDLAFLSLQKILGQRPHRMEALRSVIGQQVAELRAHGALRIHLHPLDLAAIGPVAGDSIEVVADDRLPLGGCTVQSARGVRDVGLAGQLARLGQVWLDLLAEETAAATAGRTDGVMGTLPAAGRSAAP